MEKDKILPCILFVDDDPTAHFIHKLLFRRLKLSINLSFADSAQEGLDILLKCHNDPNTFIPKILFIDINMPVEDGWDFLRKYQKLPSHISSSSYVIMLSSTLDETEIARAEEHKAVYKFMSKPLTEAKILDLFKELQFNQPAVE